MRTFQIASTILSISLATIAVAGDFDGDLPLTCSVQKSHDCLPTKSSCESTTPKNSEASIVGINFVKKQIRSPYRKELLPVKDATKNADSLVLQGGDSFIAWSGLVDRKTGALTIALADREGAYIYFGTCAVAGKK